MDRGQELSVEQRAFVESVTSNDENELGEGRLDATKEENSIA